MHNVSVIITVFNGEKYLRACVDSLINQSLRNIELIFVDDGSTDNSVAILKNYAEKDNRIRILQQVNKGAGPARNNGMKHASGEYIIFLDCDDVFEFKMLEKMYFACIKDDLDVVVCRSDKFSHNPKKRIDCPWTIKKDLLPKKTVFTSKDVERNFFMVFVWWAWDKLYKKSFVDKLNIEFQSLRTTNDLFFSVCTVMMAERISYINDVLVHHRVGNQSSLSVTREKSWHCFYEALVSVRSFMKNNGLYERFEQDYINYCLHFSMWHLETLHGYSYCLLYNALRNEWFNDLGINAKAESYFYDEHLYTMKNYIMDTDIEHHLSTKVFELEKKLFDSTNNISVYNSKIFNMYMRVKLYYKGHGLKNTIKKIIEKLLY